MARLPDIGNVQLYPNGPLPPGDKNGFVLKFYCPIRGVRIRRNCGTRDRREARRIQRECRDRLLNGKYAESGGAITAEHEKRTAVPVFRPVGNNSENERTWEEAVEHYRDQHKRRVRRKSKEDSTSRLDIAKRIFEARRKTQGLAPGVTLRECMTLEALEYLQGQLLDGAESRYGSRSPNTTNSMMAAIMAFARYSFDHEWIDRVPPLRKIDVDEVMRGRPITGEEFERMLEAVPKVVGEGPAESWKLAMNILWESGFRIADLLDFSWDDITRIHPVWPHRKGQHPTLVIPSTQKNGKNEEIPMLPGLAKLLEAVPEAQRQGFVAEPLPVEFEMKSQKAWFMPCRTDLERLIGEHSNCSIAKACGVSEQTVRNWRDRLRLGRETKGAHRNAQIPPERVDEMKKRALREKHRSGRAKGRLTTERVSRIIAQIGETAKVIVREANKAKGCRTKYASAHDLRRSCAERLINAGVSAETLMVVMRHKDFATTRKFYGAKRAAQAAAGEIFQKLVVGDKKEELVGGFVGGKSQTLALTPEEQKKLKAFAESL